MHLSVEQEQVLEAQFGRVKNPHSTDLVLLAAETGLQETDVQVGPDLLYGTATNCVTYGKAFSSVLSNLWRAIHDWCSLQL